MGTMREISHPAVGDLRIVNVFHALSDPARLGIVARLLTEGEIACADFDLPFAKATRAHHFRVLRESGLIRVRWEGKHQYAALREPDLEARFPGLADVIRRHQAEQT
ncbi:ArsR/SmtB family transcription factor [Actinomadura sp. 9N215]|uniref:ArsR/SmtB family transcription factor n=1 Tax=Actinomadura sp. 9N215 TaxID=3375150 RepID=UPI00379B184C